MRYLSKRCGQPAPALLRRIEGATRGKADTCRFGHVPIMTDGGAEPALGASWQCGNLGGPRTNLGAGPRAFYFLALACLGVGGVRVSFAQLPSPRR